jgi:NADH-quinone oxidoreductase subunit G
VRYGWKFIHDETRLTLPAVRGEDPFESVEAPLAWEAAYARAGVALGAGHVALMVSPMLTCEDAYQLARLVTDLSEKVTFAVGPVAHVGQDKTFPSGFTVRAEKAPNARGVRRVLEKFSANVVDYDAFVGQLRGTTPFDTLLLTGNYPSDWVTDDFLDAIGDRTVVLIDTFPTKLAERAEVVIPSATWAEKAGTFENVNNRLQAFERAIEPIDYCKNESQIALDLAAALAGQDPQVFNPATTRQQMADVHGLTEFLTDLHMPAPTPMVDSDMQMVEV